MLKVLKDIMSCLGVIFTLILMVLITIAIDDIRSFQQDLLQQQQIETEQLQQEIYQMKEEVKELQVYSDYLESEVFELLVNYEE